MIRIRTTGGGGWGDPLRRDPALVVRDVVWRKVSAGGRAGRRTAWCSPAPSTTTASGTTPTRPPPSAPARPAASEAFFDRGPGYARLAGGAAYAEVDLLALVEEGRLAARHETKRTGHAGFVTGASAPSSTSDSRA